MNKLLSNRTSQMGWVLYDFANSTYHLMLPTILMPLYFRGFLAPGASDLSWALVISIPILLAGILGPLLGAFADFINRRFWIWIMTTFAAVGFAVMLTTVDQNNANLGILLFVVSYLLFTLSLSLYDAFLPVLSERNGRATLSGLGWGLGYLGGVVALVATYPFLNKAVLPQDASAFRISILITCALYSGAAAIAFFLMTRRVHDLQSSSASIPANFRGAIPMSSRRVVGTIRRWKENSNFFKILLAFYLANDGLATLMYFTSIYAASTLGFTSKQILVLFMIVQLVGIPTTIFAGWLADRIGSRKVIFASLALWILLSMGFAWGNGINVFYALSVGTGLVIGTTPALFRALLADYIPKEREAEMFGFGALSSRVSAVMGPLLFGLISTFSNQRVAILSLVVFFALSTIFLAKVTESSSKHGNGSNPVI